MRRAGTERAGYSVEWDGSEMSVRVWGFWDVAVAETFAAAVVESLPGVKRMTLDALALKPLRDEAERAFVAVLATIPARSLAATVIVNATMRLQLQRLVKTARADGLVRFRSTAAQQTPEDLVESWARGPKLQ
jgi:hypothetical protein